MSIDNSVDCALYFQNRPEYRRIMEEILKKYRGLGRVGGQVCLSDATQAECEAARAFFGRSFSQPLKFEMQAFEAALQETPYRGVTVPALLDAYFGVPVQTKHEVREQAAHSLYKMIAQAMETAQSDVCRRWLSDLAGNRDNRYSQTRKILAKKGTAKALRYVCDSINWLEEHRDQAVRLAVLSAQATSDPHSLDNNTSAGKLLLHLLAYQAGVEFPKDAEQRDQLYYHGGIVCDSISSTVTQLGLILGDNGAEHPSFEAFRLRREVSTLSLTNLAVLTSASSPSGRAYLVENQMVFTQLCDQSQQFHSPLICTSGQPQVAVLRLLDLLAASGTALFYSGDFDVKGLSIADRLMARYPNHLQLWHMEPEDYTASRSQKRLDSTKLQSLDVLSEGMLGQTALALQKHGLAGYQELILPLLLHDLTETP